MPCADLPSVASFNHWPLFHFALACSSYPPPTLSASPALSRGSLFRTYPRLGTGGAHTRRSAASCCRSICGRPPPSNTIRAHAKADRDLTSAGEAPGCCGTSTRGEQQKGRERGECGTAANVLQEPGRSSPHATEVGRVEKLCLHKENEANFEPGRQAELSRPAKANPGASSLARDSLTTRWGITCSWSNR